MTNLLILIRNIVLAAVLGWFGLEFVPDAPEKQDERSAILSLLR